MATKKKAGVVLGATSALLTQTPDEACCSRSLNNEESSEEKAANNSGEEKMYPYLIDDPAKDDHDHDILKDVEGASSASRFSFFFLVCIKCQG